MSTTFDVLPGTRYVPTVEQVVSGTELLLHNFLLGHRITTQYRLRFEILKEQRHEVYRPTVLNWMGKKRKVEPLSERRTPSGSDAFLWGKDEYGWLTMEDVRGGCDCYVEEPLQPWDESCWSDEFLKLQTSGRPFIPIDAMYKNDREWSFRRSAGQPAIINVVYGLLAAQVAKLTEGVIYTIDGAWRSDKLPAYADDFVQFYFQPDHPENDQYDREWAIECIKEIRKSEDS